MMNDAPAMPHHADREALAHALEIRADAFRMMGFNAVEIAGMVRATAWRPIESAPRVDGARVLTFGCLHDDNGTDMGETPAVMFSVWDSRTKSFYSDAWGSHKPTHWMPLPEPPNQEAVR